MAKVRESYGLNNQIGHPKLERPAGRPIRKNEIFDVSDVFKNFLHFIKLGCTGKNEFTIWIF